MNEMPPSPWIHIGECPVCVNGLCRVRTCTVEAGSAHFYAMCDECEALWLTPNTDTPFSFPDSCDPKCPICQQDLYGQQAHWSLADELRGSEWMSNAIFDVPNPDSLAPDSLATLDDDANYGQDDSSPQ
jgi:hypothetical protein